MSQEARHLWKNIKTQKNKYLKSEESEPAKNAPHNLDDAFAGVDTQNMLDAKNSASKGSGKSKKNTKVLKDQQHEIIDANGLLQLQQMENKNVNDHANDEEQLMDFGGLPIVVLEDDAHNDNEEPMTLSNGSMTKKSRIAYRISIIDRMKTEFETLKLQYQSLVQLVKVEKESYLQYLKDICQMIVVELSETSMITPSFSSPASLQTRICELIQTLTHKNNEIQDLNYNSSAKSDQLQRLKAQIKQLQEENEAMSETIFDYEQRIAQLDLEIDNRVMKELSSKDPHQSNKNGRSSGASSINSRQKRQNFLDRDFFANEMAAMEKQLQNMSERYQREEQVFKEKAQTLLQKEQEIKWREQRLERQVHEYELAKVKAEQRADSLRKKQFELNLLQKNLNQKEARCHGKLDQITKMDIMNQNRNLYAEQQYSRGSEEEYIPTRLRSQTDKGYQPFNIYANRPEIKIRDNSIRKYQSPPQDNNFKRSNFQPNRPQTQLHPPKTMLKPLNDQVLSQAIERGRRKLDTSYSSGKAFPGNSRLSGSGMGVHGGSGFSVSSHQRGRIIMGENTRLHDLGNKLQKLRQQIRNQIKETV